MTTPADQYRDLVRRRTGLAGANLYCPREMSSMTPCIARDGNLAVVHADHAYRCVGCDHPVDPLLDAERQKHDSATLDGLD